MAGSRVPSVGAGMAGKGVLAVARVAAAMASCGDGAPCELRRRAPAEDLRWKEDSEMGATARRGASGAAMGAHREGSGGGDGSDGAARARGCATARRE